MSEIRHFNKFSYIIKFELKRIHLRCEVWTVWTQTRNYRSVNYKKSSFNFKCQNLQIFGFLFSNVWNKVSGCPRPSDLTTPPSLNNLNINTLIPRVLLRSGRITIVGVTKNSDISHTDFTSECQTLGSK